MRPVDPARWQLWRQTSPDIGGFILRQDPPPSKIRGQQHTHLTTARVEEYVDRSGAVISRRVCALGAELCWLDASLIPEIPKELH